LFSQHKMIEWLEEQISKPKIDILKPRSIIKRNFTQL